MPGVISPYTAAFLCAFLSALGGILYRISMRARIDGWALSFTNSLAGGLFLLALLPQQQLAEIDLPILALLIVSGLIWMLAVYWDLLAYEALDVSLNALLSTARLITQCVVGAVLFHELIGLQALTGIGLIVLAILSGIRAGLIGWNRSVLLRCLSILAATIALTLDKYLSTLISFENVLLASYFIPAISFLVLRPGTLAASINLIKTIPMLLIANILLFSAVGYTLLYSISFAGFGAATAIRQSSIFFAFVIGALFLHERSKLISRLIAALLSMAGAMLVADA